MRRAEVTAEADDAVHRGEDLIVPRQLDAAHVTHVAGYPVAVEILAVLP